VFGPLSLPEFNNSVALFSACFFSVKTLLLILAKIETEHAHLLYSAHSGAIKYPEPANLNLKPKTYIQKGDRAARG
jgi:hypothetical protein